MSLCISLESGDVAMLALVVPNVFYGIEEKVKSLKEAAWFKAQ